MNSDFWLKKWTDNDIGFHQSKFHPALKKFGSNLNAGTLLVPLCGKSLDMLYWVSAGHSVIGVELSPIACRDFFKETKIPFTEKKHGEFIVFKSDSITLFCGDFFHLPKEVWTRITGIYDRAALVALPPEMRKQYVSEISRNTHKPLSILLINFEYPEGVAEGPPFSVPQYEIKKLYSDFKIQKLQTDRVKLRTTEADESVYLIQRT